MPRQNLTSDAVLATAALLADRDGFDSVTVSSVARELDVKPASLYEHIRDREALFDGIQRRGLGDLGDRIADAVAGRSRLAALSGLATAYREYATERPGVWRALQRPATAETAESPAAARVASLTLAVVEGYGIPAGGRIHATRFVAAAVNGFLSLSRAQAFEHRADDEDESWRAAVAALDRALQTWPAPAAQPDPAAQPTSAGEAAP